jgi:hypothetical protein
VVAVLAGSRQSVQDIYGMDNIGGEHLPLVHAGDGRNRFRDDHHRHGHHRRDDQDGIGAAQVYTDLAVPNAAPTLGLAPAARKQGAKHYVLRCNNEPR